MNKTNLGLLGAHALQKQQSQRPEVNWRRLNDSGKVERATEITGKSVISGVAKADAHAAYDEAAGGGRPSLGQHAKRTAEGSLISGALHAAKDTFDTVADRPNSGEYRDGSKFSNREADGSPKKESGGAS